MRDNLTECPSSDQCADRPINPLQLFGDVLGAPACGANEHVILARAWRNEEGKTVFPSYVWDGDPPFVGRTAWYACLSTSSSIPQPNGYGKFRVSREESRMAWSYLLAADDIGTKISRAAIDTALPPATFENETSPGNFQFLWALARPAHPAHLRAGLAWMIARGLTDPGASGANRLVRTPGSRNDKPEVLVRNGGRPFFTRVVVARPDHLYELTELVKIDEAAVRRSRGCRRPGPPFRPELQRLDKVYRWLRSHGLVLSEPNTHGWVEILCPWASLHTDPDDDLAGWRIGRHGHFHCFHAHGKKHGTPEFIAWLRKQAQQHAERDGHA